MSVLFPKTYAYKPFSIGIYDKGKYSSGYLSESTFIGNVQPSNQKEIDSLNIGRDTRGMIKVYTDQVFNMSIEDTNINGDLIIYDGNEWEVIKLDNNTGSLLPHRRYFAELRLNDDFGDE